MRHLLVLTLALIIVVPARAQDDGHRFLGYSAKVTAQPVGVVLGYHETGGFGYLIDAKWGPALDVWGDEVRRFTSVSAAEGEGAVHVRDQAQIIAVSGAATYGVAQRFFVYAGWGATMTSSYSRFENAGDPLDETDDEAYWLRDTRTRTNVLGGLGFRFTRLLTVLVGAETEPAGVTLALGVGL